MALHRFKYVVLKIICCYDYYSCNNNNNNNNVVQMRKPILLFKYHIIYRNGMQTIKELQLQK
jgi:hypothetical protein